MSCPTLNVNLEYTNIDLVFILCSTFNKPWTMCLFQNLFDMSCHNWRYISLQGSHSCTPFPIAAYYSSYYNGSAKSTVVTHPRYILTALLKPVNAFIKVRAAGSWELHHLTIPLQGTSHSDLEINPCFFI